MKKFYKNMKYVLMVPLRRCGSNAIRLRMNLHPNFYSPYPLHLCDMIGWQKQYQTKEDMDYFQMVVDMVGLQRHSLVPWHDIVLDPLVVFENIKDKPRSLYQIYWEMLSQLGQKKKVHVIMDKSQDSICDFEELLSLFPDMLFLDVVRDPRAQISSMNQAIIYDFETSLNTLRWVKSRQWVDRLRQKYPDHIMTIRYEDFILNHEETLKKICHYVNLPFDPILLNIHNSKEAYVMSHLSPLWETNYNPPITEPLEKYKHFLTIQEIEHIETMTLPWMKQYHYLPLTLHKFTISYPLHGIHKQNEEKKKTAWEMLKKNYPQDYILRTTRMRFITNCVKKNL